jgi:hypothetical protein
MPYPHPHQEEFHIRLPKTLAVRIRQMAEDNCRSTTKQIEYLVRQAVMLETKPFTVRETRG